MSNKKSYSPSRVHNFVSVNSQINQSINFNCQNSAIINVSHDQQIFNLILKFRNNVLQAYNNYIYLTFPHTQYIIDFQYLTKTLSDWKNIKLKFREQIELFQDNFDSNTTEMKSISSKYKQQIKYLNDFVNSLNDPINLTSNEKTESHLENIIGMPSANFNRILFGNLERFEQLTPTTTYSTPCINCSIEYQTSYFSLLEQKSISTFFIKFSKKFAKSNLPLKPYQHGTLFSSKCSALIFYPIHSLRFYVKKYIKTFLFIAVQTFFRIYSNRYSFSYYSFKQYFYRFRYLGIKQFPL